MSRFTKAETKVVELGACECPGTPHQTDQVVIRKRLSYGPLMYVADAPSGQAMLLRLLETGIESWNFLDDEGKPVEVNATTIASLDPESATLIGEAINAERKEAKPLPNGSGARSEGSSPASASQPH